MIEDASDEVGIDNEVPGDFALHPYAELEALPNRIILGIELIAGFADVDVAHREVVQVLGRKRSPDSANLLRVNLVPLAEREGQQSRLQVSSHRNRLLRRNVDDPGENIGKARDRILDAAVADGTRIGTFLQTAPKQFGVVVDAEAAAEYRLLVAKGAISEPHRRRVVAIVVVGRGEIASVERNQILWLREVAIDERAFKIPAKTIV